MARNWWLPLILAITLAFALAVSACGGDDDDDDADNSGDNPTATATAGDDDGEATPTDEAEPTETDDTSGDDDDSGDHPVPDVCEILSADEVADIVGLEFEEGVTYDDPVKPECDFEVVDPSSAVAVYLQVYWTGDRADAEAEYDIFDDGSEPVDGYGDKAHWLDTFGSLEVLTGDYTVILQLVDLRSEADALTEAKAVMDIVLPRLP